YRMGDQQVVDMMVHDGLTCSFNQEHMGTYGNSTANEYEVDRKAQDEWAYRSHQRAIKAMETGKFNDEIVPVDITQRKENMVLVYEDESSRNDKTLYKIDNLIHTCGEK